MLPAKAFERVSRSGQALIGNSGLVNMRRSSCPNAGVTSSDVAT
jgi:hypothetical protein